MGNTAGSNNLQQAANDNGGGQNKPLPAPGKCKKPTSELTIVVRRADKPVTKVGGIQVTATAGSALTHASAAGTGRASFGTVAADTYKIGVKLTEEQRKAYRPPSPKSVPVDANTDVLDSLDLPPVSRLKIVLKNIKDAKVSGVEWSLQTTDKKTGTTGADGLIDAEVSWRAANGELTLKFPDEPDAFVKAPPRPPPPPARNAVPYPIPIRQSQFEAQEPNTVQFPKTLEFKVQIREIENGEGTDGAKARLHNLGFRWDSPNTLTRSVIHYQKWFMNSRWRGSGKIEDIVADLKTRHDNG